MQYTELLSTAYKIYNKTGESLLDLLKLRIYEHKKKLYFNLSIAIVGLLSFIYLFIGVYLSIINSIQILVESSDKIAKGELSIRVNLETHDELTEVGYSFNHMGQTLASMMPLCMGPFLDDCGNRVIVVGSFSVEVITRLQSIPCIQYTYETCL